MKRSARKELLDLPSHVAERVETALDGLCLDPFHARPGVDLRPLAGRGLWRLRVGDYRILYEVVGQTILVTEVGHRSTVYRP